MSNTASGIPTYNLRDARVRIVGNTLETASDGTEVGDSTGLDFLLANNRVTTVFASYTTGRLRVDGLHDPAHREPVRVAYGFYVDSLFGEQVACRVVGNDVTYDVAAVYLGHNTHDCLVAGAGTVLDDGVNNRVVGQH